MFKKTILAVSTIALLGAAVPAMARSFDDDGDADWAAYRALTSLQQMGVKATRVSDLGDLIRADVKASDGTTKFQYFDAVTFEQVNP